jgi:histidinol dehydrogenase
MEISGHKTEAIYRRYDIVVDSDIKAAAKKMTEYHAQQRPQLKVVGSPGRNTGQYTGQRPEKENG